MNDLDAALRAMYQARSQTPEPPALLDEVLAIPDLDSSQQRRWLPLPTRRFQSMVSATGFVVAGAVVALLGGLLLVAQPLDRQEGSLSPAVADPEVALPVEFTATTLWNEPGVVAQATDPRVEGTMTDTLLASQTYGDVEVTVQAGARIENDSGAWQEVPGLYGFTFPADVDESGEDVPEDGVAEDRQGDGERRLHVFTGEGGYEGFFIVAEATYSATRLASDLHGYIIEGDLPVAPEPPSVE